MVFGFGQRYSLLTKFQGALLLAVLPLLLLQHLYVLPTVRERLRADRIRTMRLLVESAYGILEAHEARVRAGTLSADEARRSAAELLRGLRYAGTDYYWLNDLDARLVMHPYLDARIGEDMTGFLDASGRPVFQDIVALVRARGEGPMEYFVRRPGSPEPSLKLSYVKLFEPWGWVLGTGAYQADLEEEVRAIQWRLWVALLVGVGLTVGAGTAFSQRLLQPLRALGKAAGRVARGDLRATVDLPSLDEMGDMGQAFNFMVVHLRDVLGDMGEASRSTEADARHIHRAADELRLGAQQQSHALRSMAAAVLGMTEQLVTGAAQAQRMTRTAEVNEQLAREGGGVVSGTGEKMKEIARAVDRSTRTVERLSEWSEEVERSMELISDVADQTRVLAVNTSIEAMRAGEYGRGFTVVAEEVRKLAEQARAAADRIRTLMRQSHTETQAAAAQMREGRARVQEGLVLSARTGAALERIVAGAEDLQRLLQESAASQLVEAETGETLSLRIHTLSKQAESSAQEVAHITQAVEDLSTRARRLRERVTHFQVDDPFPRG